MALELWIPGTAKPAHKCWACGAEFYGEEKDKYIRHVPRCAAKHREELLEASRINAERDPLHQATDTEALDWMRKRMSS